MGGCSSLICKLTGARFFEFVIYESCGCSIIFYLAMGSNILLLLGLICWTIFTRVWLTCSAAVARINPPHTTNPLYVRRALIQYNVKHKHIHQGELLSLYFYFCISSLPLFDDSSLNQPSISIYNNIYSNQPCISIYII